MRAYLRETCDDIWVIDCSPEGHQPEVNTRIFQGVQQPVCIVMASRSGKKTASLGAVHFAALPKGRREQKFTALRQMRLASKAWTPCPGEARSPFLPASTGAWSDLPRLEDLFVYNGSGVQPGRTWIIAPDVDTLTQRWQKLLSASSEQKEALFHPHLRDGIPGDRHSRKVMKIALHNFSPSTKSLAESAEPCPTPIRYGYRSFDRQWIIPDIRVINQPNPRLWELRGDSQIFMTVLARSKPSSGPALSISGHIPDYDHYKGSFGGRVLALWADDIASIPNVSTAVLAALSTRLKEQCSAEDVFSYIAGIAAHPAYTARFSEELNTPGLRVPFTSDSKLFRQTVAVGNAVIWLHTFGERMVDPEHGRPAQPPRLPLERRPLIPKEGAISQDPEGMPDTMSHDAGKHRLLVGKGFIDKVTPAMWAYEVSGKQVLTQWFSYRKRNRERPIIGDRRKPSALGNIQPNHWLPEYTAELLNVLNVLGILIDLESQQADLLERVCSGSLISAKELKDTEVGAPMAKPKRVREAENSGNMSLFS